MTPEQEIDNIKRETFDALKESRQVWIIEERGVEFIVHRWSGNDGQYGPGVGPPSSHPTLRKAAARLLQLLCRREWVRQTQQGQTHPWREE